MVLLCAFLVGFSILIGQVASQTTSATNTTGAENTTGSNSTGSTNTTNGSDESHTVTFTNNCGHGTPKLVQGGNILSTGQEYTHSGEFAAAIAYLDNGKCKLNGEGCGTVEITLRNSVAGNGDGSGCDISLIPPLAFSDPLGFKYVGGCDTLGAFCGESGCNTAFYKSDDNCVQVACQENNVGVNVIFCGDSTHGSGTTCSGSTSGNSTSASGTSAQANSSTAGAAGGSSTTSTSAPSSSTTAPASKV